jgi:hypothetical protein
LEVRGVNRKTNLQLELAAFQKGFTRAKCFAAWKKVGTATPKGVTRTCLNDNQVMMSITGNDEEDRKMHWSIQNANDLAFHALTQGGYDAHWQKTTLEKKKEEQSITQLNTREAAGAGKCA